MSNVHLWRWLFHEIPIKIHCWSCWSKIVLNKRRLGPSIFCICFWGKLRIIILIIFTCQCSSTSTIKLLCSMLPKSASLRYPVSSCWLKNVRWSELSPIQNEALIILAPGPKFWVMAINGKLAMANLPTTTISSM